MEYYISYSGKHDDELLVVASKIKGGGLPPKKKERAVDFGWVFILYFVCIHVLRWDLIWEMRVISHHGKVNFNR